MEPIQLMIEDLGRQVAQKAVETSEWKARALIAEHALEQIQAAEEAEETETETDEPLDNVVELVPDDGESQDD